MPSVGSCSTILFRYLDCRRIESDAEFAIFLQLNDGLRIGGILCRRVTVKRVVHRAVAGPAPCGRNRASPPQHRASPRAAEVDRLAAAVITVSGIDRSADLFANIRALVPPPQ